GCVEAERNGGRPLAKAVEHDRGRLYRFGRRLLLLRCLGSGTLLLLLLRRLARRLLGEQIAELVLAVLGDVRYEVHSNDARLLVALPAVEQQKLAVGRPVDLRHIAVGQEADRARSSARGGDHLDLRERLGIGQRESDPRAVGRPYGRRSAPAIGREIAAVEQPVGERYAGPRQGQPAK